jgi:hypothetical protein
MAGPVAATRACIEYGSAPAVAQELCQSAALQYPWGPTREMESSVMNAQTDISMKSDEVLRVELEVFRREHRDLDEAIRALTEKATGDQLTIQRLKKKKLQLKDLIARIEDRLLPDIIA